MASSMMILFAFLVGFSLAFLILFRTEPEGDIVYDAFVTPTLAFGTFFILLYENFIILLKVKKWW